MRFRKRITLAPGIRLNVSGSGLSLSVGPRGASMTFGPRGTFLNAGIPGTGLYSRQRLVGKEPSYQDPPADTETIDVTAALSLREDGTWVIFDKDGSPLLPGMKSVLLKQHRSLLADSLEQLCEEANTKIDGLGQAHWSTPDPADPPVYEPKPFRAEPPSKPGPPVLQHYSLLNRILWWQRDAVDEANAIADQRYETALAAWHANWAKFEKERIAHDEAETTLALMYTSGVLHDPDSVQAVLEHRLQSIQWPRQTTVEFDVSDSLDTVTVEVDLPEIEDMPAQRYVVRRRDLEVDMEPRPATHIRKLYMTHVHGVGLRIVGEIFHGLPRTNVVVISAYTQRLDKSSGHVTNQYLYSARVTRARWMELNWQSPKSIDPVEAFARFDLRREMTKTGIFKSIVPYR